MGNARGPTRNQNTQNTVREGELIRANELNRPNGIPIEPDRSNRMLWILSIAVVLAAAGGMGIILMPLIVDSLRGFFDEQTTLPPQSQPVASVPVDQPKPFALVTPPQSEPQRTANSPEPGTPARPKRTDELRIAEHQARIAAAAAFEDPRRRATALLAIVFEQIAIGDLTGARRIAEQIQEPKRRARAFQRIATAEAAPSDR